MTEQEWLTSEDPQAMLGWWGTLPADGTDGEGRAYVVRPSDRKLRLFAAACAWNVADAARSCSNVDQFIRDTEAWAETGQAPPGVRESSAPVDIHDRAADHAMGAASWAHCHRGDRTAAELNAAQAALLRDIAGNPWRPVEIAPDCYECHGRGRWAQGYHPDFECPECDGAGKRPCPWLTPTVVSLAQAAYDERVAPCGRCGGSGTLLDIEDFDTDARTEESCDRCHGTGIIDDGTLDPVRLAILADALEEAGCGGDVVAHLRRPANCNACDSTGIGMDEYSGTVEVPGHCPRCGGQVGPHYRGCWALDLILGKE